MGAPVATPPALPAVVAGTDWGGFQALIGVTSIALAVLAILVAIVGAALVFYGRDWLRDVIEKEVERRTAAHERELRGRVVGYVGFIFGRLRDVRPDFLHSAIHYSEAARDFLPDDSSYKITAINNLAFYYATRGYVTDAPAAVAYAKRVLEEYAISKKIDRLTTYASVVAVFHNYFDNPRRALLDAEKMMQELEGRDDISVTEKQNAARHLVKIRAALQTVQ